MFRFRFLWRWVLDEKLVQVGNTIPMRDNAGNRLNGVVKAVTDSNVNMDFNHPLAGNHLFFSGEVTDVREATDEELSHGHVHAEGCGGGCGCGDEARIADVAAAIVVVKIKNSKYQLKSWCLSHQDFLI
jgi:FKBP-type peptidyl-prolyl cis-trans isomerase 2